MECYAKKTPNGHTTSNRHLFDGDITLIRQRENIDEFQVILTYFFDVTSMSKKPTCFDVLSLM